MYKMKFARITIAALFIFALFFSPQSAYAQKSLSLIIHYSEAEPNTESSNYNVKLYFSVLDANNNPVLGLHSQDFTLTEDTKPISISRVEQANDVPSNLVLVLDTSGSMRGGGIEAAQKASANFIDRLGSRDRVAVFSFNDSVNQVVDFTADHKAVVEKIKQIEAKYQAGTCLYDAVVQAVQMAGTTAAGRRAVLVLTDGKDEVMGGGPCSSNKTEDVINVATNAAASVPVYALGIGKGINEPDLKRMTTRTSGMYLGSGEVSQVEELFGKLSNSLNSEYVLEYTSNNAPGIHNITLEANYKESKDLQAKAVNLPAMPTNLTITSPAQNDKVSGKIKILVSVPTKSEPITRMVFMANDKSIGEVTKAPFEFDWDTATAIKQNESPLFSLMVIAYSVTGKELGRSETTNVFVDTSNVAAAPQEATTAPTESEPTPAAAETSNPAGANPLVIGLIALGVIILGVGGFLLFKNKSKSQPAAPEAPFVVGGGRNTSGSLGGKTSEELNLSGLVSLKVQKAKDPNMIGTVYYVTKSQTYIGSSAECDLVFGQGTGVSRRHAVIEIKGGEFQLREGLSPDGSRPSYRTFIDGKVIEPDMEPVRLMNGMVIRLGNLTEMQFSNQSAGASSSRTFEEIDVSQIRKDTMEIKQD
jgi:Ca-activated chloride channel family protein